MKKLRYILQSRYLFKILTIFFLGYAILITNMESKSIYNINADTFVGIITKYKIDNSKMTIYLTNKETIVVSYYLKEKDNFSFSLGDTISVKGTLSVPKNNTIPNTFNYKRYLYNQGIYYLLKADSITKIKSNENIIYEIRNNISKKIDKISKSSNYLKTFLLGDKSEISEEVISSYQNNGILHLFSISGMHISLLAGILLFLLKKISYNNKFNYLIVILFLLFYLFILDFLPSVLRTFIMFTLFSINKVFNLKIKKTDILLLVLIIIIIINPFLIYNIGFQYSYLVSFTLIIKSKDISKIKNYFIKNLYISYLAFIVSLPITISNFYQINVLGIILNIFMVPFISFVVFPLSIITMIFPFLDNILYFFVSLLENVSLIINNINIFKIILMKPNTLIIIIYIIFIILTLFKNKYLFLLIILIVIHKFSVYFYPYLNIIFLDVGEGDSSLIMFPYNKGNIMIDTGGNLNNDYLSDNLATYLHSVGKNKIDYLILTHGDCDHMGAAISLVDKIKIENIIFNKGDINSLEKELINKIDNRINYYLSDNILNVSEYKFYFLNENIYSNENDNSNIIYFKYFDNAFLFLGDAPKRVEEDIINNYFLKDITIVKIGHHGSKTSTSNKLVNDLNIKNAIISVGKNNIYHFPNKETLSKLKDINVIRTDIFGSILFSFRENNYTKMVYPP